MCGVVLKSRELAAGENGFVNWKVKTEKTYLNPEKTAVIIVDMWDRHWCAGANIRCAVIAEKIDSAARAARDRGILIVHAPSDTMNFYKESEARKRLLSVPVFPGIPVVREIKDYPQPVDSSDGGSDTPSIDEYPPDTQVWKRQTDKIYIDESRDIIGDEGDLIYSYLRRRDICNIIYMGVHTNMCVLNRSFAVKAMLRRGMNVMLCGNLTDAMYNPGKPPYVSHDEGTQLVIEYIEKFYCPTIETDDGFLRGDVF